MTRQSVRLLLAALTLLAAASPGAHAQGGVVQGQVVNGTVGGTAALSDLPVRLYLFSGDQLKDTRRTSTDSQGVFRFEGVPTGAAWTAQAVVEYMRVEYGSKPLDLAAGTDFNGDIVVYDTTTDDSALRVDHAHLIVHRAQGQLEVTEIVRLINGGDRTYVGSQEVIPQRRATARLALPAGATDVLFPSSEVGSAMVRTGQGFVDTRPVIPGRQDYMLSYALSCGGSTYNLLKPILYPTAVLDLLVAEGIEVNAPAMERLGTREAPGVTYTYLTARSLSKGNDLMIRFSGLDQAPVTPGEAARGLSAGSVRREGLWHQAALGTVPLAALAALALLLIACLRRPEAESWPLAARQTVPAVQSERERLIAGLALLDERYEAGELDLPAYRRQREAEKSRLLYLLLSPQGKESEARRDERARAARRRAGARAGKAVRARGRAPQRRPKTG